MKFLLIPYCAKDEKDEAIPPLPEKNSSGTT